MESHILESRIFVWTTFIATVAFIILAITDGIFFLQLRTSPLTPGQIGILALINFILALIFFLLFLWVIYRLVFRAGGKRSQTVTVISSPTPITKSPTPIIKATTPTISTRAVPNRALPATPTGSQMSRNPFTPNVNKTYTPLVQ